MDDQGSVHVFWENDQDAPIGTGLHSQILHRKSADHGGTFSPADTVAFVRQNWYSGPPGFNRRNGFWEFPNVAVDFSGGPDRGSLYVAWNEACEPVFSGTPGATQAEAEPNSTPAGANLVVLPKRVTGTIGTSDGDYFKFSGLAGQMVRLTCTPVDTLFPWIRLSNAPAADTFLVDVRNGYGEPAAGWVTLPASGTWYVDLRSRFASNAGAYVLDLETVTAGAGSRALDHRDIVLTASHDHGATWSTPVRVNDDPPGFDNCMPQLTVDSIGIVHTFWYDRRNDPLRGGRADLYYSRSTDGGATWAANVRISDFATTWQVPARAAPNFGDYSNATATGNTILPFWADGRFGTPDVFTAALHSGYAFAWSRDTLLVVGDTLRAHFEVTNVSPYTERFVYTVADSLGMFAPVTDSLPLGPGTGAQVVYQRPLTSLASNENDPLVVTAFHRSTAYAKTICRSVLYLRTSVAAVAGAGEFETRLLGVWPNPAPGATHVAFSLARPGTARISVYDVGGRRVARPLDGPLSAGRHEITWDGSAAGNRRLAGGVYFVRAELLGQGFVRRVVRLD